MAVFETTFFSNALHRLTEMTAIIPVERPSQNMGGDGKPAIDKFRALVLLHGYSGTHSDWIRGSSIQEYAMKHNIAVFMPSGENAFYLDDTKRAALYEKFLTEDIIDFIRTVFPVSDKREDTAIGGFSMGGYGALHTGLKYGEVYGSVIALSSAIMGESLAKMKPDDKNPIAPYSYYEHTFGDLTKFMGSDKDLKALARNAADKGSAPAIYIACGTEDFGIEQNRNYDRFLKDSGISHTYEEGPGVHNWTFWNEYIERALNWLDEQK